MKKIISTFCFAVVLVLCHFTCSKDDKNVNPGSNKELSIDGFITDGQGLYIQDVSISFGNANTTTDANGYFQIPLTKYTGEAYIKANKQGYFAGSRTLFLEKSKSAHVRISLLQKSFSKFFNTANNAIIDNGKVKLEFPANSIVNESGQVYNGKVNVAIQYLDPTDYSIRNIMPGDLVGLNINNEMQQLGSYGMAAIELQSTSGAKLQIKENVEVMLKIEIPQSLRANAPTTIPLWYFDEITGLWKEQGTATKNGNLYEGKVKHFSFWNCDISWPLVHLQGRIIDYSGSPVSNSNVVLTIVKSELKGYGRTNQLGIFEGKVPKNEALILDLTDECNNVILSKNIGPFAFETDMGNIQIVTNSSHLVSIEGTILDCNDIGLPNALVLIKSGALTYSMKTNIDGIYNNSLILCNNNPISITAYNLNTFKQSNTIIYNLPGPIIANPLKICNDTIQYDEFVKFTISDGTSKIFLTELQVFTQQTNAFHILEAVIDSIPVFNLVINGTPTQNTPAEIARIQYFSKNSILDTFYFAVDPINAVGILQYSSVASKTGEYYEGNFNGMKISKKDLNLRLILATDLTINGTFRIKRKQ